MYLVQSSYLLLVKIFSSADALWFEVEEQADGDEYEDEKEED